MSAGVPHTIELLRETGASEYVAHDAACLNCGYNLRTLKMTSNCPECGMAVAASLRRDYLAHAPIAWRRRLLAGATALQIGVICSIPFFFPGVIIAVWGLYQLTDSQPGRSEPAFDRTHRTVARVCLVMGLTLLSIMTIAGLILLFQYRFFALRAGRFYDFFFGIAFSMIIIGMINAWYYLAALAGRIPDNRLVDRLRILRRRWFTALAAGVVVALYAGASNLLHPYFPMLDIRVSTYDIELWLFIAGGSSAAILTWLWWHTLQIIKQVRSSLADLVE